MKKWWVNEIKLRNFTLNLNEKLYLSILAKSICLKYFENSQMVLNIFCNDDRIYDKITWVISIYVFRFMYLKVILSRPIFFDEGTRLNFGEVVAILSVTPTVFCSPERKSSVLRKTKTDVRNTMGQDRLSHRALLSRFSTNRLLSHEWTFFAANTSYYTIISITQQKSWRKKSRNTFYFLEAKKLANQSHC